MSNKTFIKNAKYAFTITGEFKKSIELDKDEKVIIKRNVKICKVLYRPGYFALTTKRLVFIKHYLFAPDRVISIDIRDLKGIGIKESGILSLLTLLRKYKYISLDFKYKSKIKKF